MQGPNRELNIHVFGIKLEIVCLPIVFFLAECDDQFQILIEFEDIDGESWRITCSWIVWGPRNVLTSTWNEPGEGWNMKRVFSWIPITWIQFVNLCLSDSSSRRYVISEWRRFQLCAIPHSKRVVTAMLLGTQKTLFRHSTWQPIFLQIENVSPCSFVEHLAFKINQARVWEKELSTGLKTSEWSMGVFHWQCNRKQNTWCPFHWIFQQIFVSFGSKIFDDIEMTLLRIW